MDPFGILFKNNFLEGGLRQIAIKERTERERESGMANQEGNFFYFNPLE